MPMTIEITEAQMNLRAIIAKLEPNEEIVITDNQHPIASLSLKANRPGPGLCKGMITIISEDDEHLIDFNEYM